MLFRGSVEYFMNNRNHKGNIYTCNNEAKSGVADDGAAAIYSPFNSLKHLYLGFMYIVVLGHNYFFVIF